MFSLNLFKFNIKQSALVISFQVGRRTLSKMLFVMQVHAFCDQVTALFSPSSFLLGS